MAGRWFEMRLVYSDEDGWQLAGPETMGIGLLRLLSALGPWDEARHWPTSQDTDGAGDISSD